MSIELKKEQKLNSFIDQLVNLLHTEEMINFIDSHCEDIIDKRTFLMFVLMYYFTLFSSDISISKESIKFFLEQIILDPVKRLDCIKLYKNIEDCITKKIK